MPILKAEKLCKTYGLGTIEVQALKSADLSIEKGEFAAIMGPSGSGKSTLLHLLGGLDSPTSGKITLQQKEISKLNDKQLTLTRRENIGFIFQFFNLLPTLSAEENIALPLVIAGEPLKNYQDRLDMLINLVGLEKRRRHLPDELSGGEQQRVAIARAFITEPAIVLADEPTGNLDSKTGRGILKLLKQSAKELNYTVIMVTHDPVAASYADRVIFLRDGAIFKEITLGGEDDTAIIIANLKELEA